MKDQANNLRELVKTRKTEQHEQHLNARVIAITSGKGGVGKTNFTVNLAIQLQKSGKKVVIIDADLGLANIEILCGVIPKYSLADVLNGDKTISAILTQGPNDIQFISGGSGIKELVNVSQNRLNHFMESLSYLDSIADIILIDTGAGISTTVINFIKAADEAVIITTPEPTAITDAYALIKTLKINEGNHPGLKIVVNRVENDAEGADIFRKLDKVANKFLGVNLLNLGYIYNDPNLIKAVKRQNPVTLSYPTSKFSKSIENISNALLDIETSSDSQSGGVTSFMKRLINIFSS